VKRSWKHDYNSIDLERYIWWGLLKFSNNASVKLKNPDVTVNIEIKDNKLFLVVWKHYGIWGYPVWTQDKVLTLISGWFDSGVSSFSLCKRWAKVDYLFFNLWWTAHELWVKQVAHYLWKNFSSGYKARFITINFEEIVKELVTKIDHKYRWIILKRLFLMAADNLAQEHKYYAIVKWDSLWQVSSQTLKNMFIVDKASSTLVLRPLISFNKQEIVDLSKKIWTYEFACNMPEYCWVISDKPATAADLDKVLKEEENFDFSLLDKAIESKKVQKIDEVLIEKVDGEDIELTYVPWENEVVIDIREDQDRKKRPLILEKIEILEIPFYDINSKFSELDQNKTYLFYCDKWVLSRLHALYLKEKGFNNIKIYRYLEKWCSLKK
jgi:thiamine biosynthesis protein ThiI